MIKVLIIPLFVLMALTARAQAPSMAFEDAQLRHLFQYAYNTNPQVKFFYDMAAHFVDSAFFNDYVTDTSNVDNWYNLYKEMYYMAYDTTLYQTAATVYTNVNPVLQSDTIPIGLMDWDYNLLRPGTLDTDIYFTFDTVNNQVHSVGGNSPYDIHCTFAGSTLRKDYPFTNPVFTIHPAWIFKDAGKNYGAPGVAFKIDFGDGSGWHQFNDYQIQYYQAHYGGGGVKTVRYGIFVNNVLKKYSLSSFFISTDDNAVAPTTVYNLPGLTANVFDPDPGCNLNVEKKYVIYVEGFDPLNSRHASQIYDEMIKSTYMSQLKNFGYSFVIVDWTNGNAPLEVNAMNLVGLIEQMKCFYVAKTTTVLLPPPPFVMVGESMGGLIARYALCYMESPSYTPTCNRGIQHNTRLLITIDAPHQGANVPIGLQYLYRYGTFGTLSAVGFSPWVIGQCADVLTALDGAATEMLKYHVATDPFLAVPVSTAAITQHPAKTAFDNALANLGNYPQHCKLVALSNGSWLGAHQYRAWDYFSKTPRQPNDEMLNVNSEVYIRVLGMKVLGTTFGLDVRTNPNGNGQVFFNGVGITHWKIKLKWFGVKVVWLADYFMQIKKNVLNVKPYCVMPASWEISPYTGVGMNPGFNSFNCLNVFGFQYSTGNGNLNVQGNLGVSFFGSANLNFNAYSDGASFGFIPTWSSFDYQISTPQALDYPILNDPISTNLARTPFHAVYTNPTDFNWDHLTEENPMLLRCATCNPPPVNGDTVHSYLLNREIGDDSLWLENTNANYLTPIEVERDFLLDYRNRYYNYVSQWGASAFNLYNFPNNYSSSGAIVISKENPVVFTNSGQLKSNDHLWVNAAQPPTGSYSWTQGNMTICCINYAQKMPSDEHTHAISAPSGSMAIFPNPTSSQLTIKYQMKNEGKVHINVYDIMGRKVTTWQTPFDANDNTRVCYYSVPSNEMDLASGVYVVELSNGTETYRSRLVISK